MEVPHKMYPQVFKGLQTETFLVSQIVQEYERAVIFRLGRVLPGARGPGNIFIDDFVDCFTSMVSCCN